jgi:hypothetical protein
MRPTALLLTLLLLAGASAHQPLFNPGSPSFESPYRIEAPDVSKVITGRLGEGEVAYHLLELTETTRVSGTLFMGNGCEATFDPTLWLVGGDEEGAAPFAVPEGYGALSYRDVWAPYNGHGVRGFRGASFFVELEPGSHYLAVHSPEGEGYYMLSLAGRELPGGTREGRDAIGRFNRCGA